MPRLDDIVAGLEQIVRRHTGTVDYARILAAALTAETGLVTGESINTGGGERVLILPDGDYCLFDRFGRAVETAEITEEVYTNLLVCKAYELYTDQSN